MTGKEALEDIENKINISNDFTMFQDCNIIRHELEDYQCKSKKYENIEQELGIDLVTFYEALTKGVWVKTNAGQIYHTNIYLHDLALSSYSSKNNFCFITPDNVLLLFDRIKQDWALTRKELEKLNN